MFDTKEFSEFLKFLHFCTEERIDALYEVFEASKDYQNLAEEQSVAYRQIYNALPQDLKNTLVRYSDRESAISDMGQIFFYERGFEDAIMLIRNLFCTNAG